MISAAMIVCLFIAIWTAAYCRWPLKSWSVLLLGILTLFHLCDVSVITLSIACVLILPVVFLLNIPLCRYHFLTRWLLKTFKATVPELSDTEKEALFAGDVWWEQELFCGQPDWQKLLSYNANTLTPEEQHFIDSKVTRLCELLNDWEIRNDLRDLSPDAWDYIRKEKFFGIIIEKKYGGLGFSAYAHSCIVNMIASRSYSAAVTVMVPNSLGPAEFLQEYGTEEQKDNYLPRLANGKDIPCFALTSPNAGSDAASITDTGVVCEAVYKGKKTIGLKLNWDKRYITLAPVATLLGIAVKVTDPDRFLGDQLHLGITFCLLPSTLKGVKNGPRHLPLTMAFMNGPTRGEDVFIPLDNVIGGPDNIGKGWHMMMNSLAVGRGISLPAVSAASAKMAYRLTGAYASVREQFRLPIGNFEGIQEALARIGGKTYVCEATRCFTVSAIDAGVKPSIASAITKYHLTELSRQCVSDAMDVHGGRGIIDGPNNYLAQFYSAAPVGITVEGANIMTRNLIIFGQGALRCHPFAAKEILAANNPEVLEGTARFDHLIFEHFGWTISNFARALFYGITFGKTIPGPKGFLKHYFKQLTRMSNALALVSDMAMMSVGANLKRKERLSSRLGDILSHLYIASAVIKYFYDNNQPDKDKIFVQWALRQCLVDIQDSLVDVLYNLPNRRLGWLMKHIIFFWGTCYRRPNDKLEQKIAKTLMKADEQRDRMTSFCYRSESDGDAVNKMQKAFEYTIAAKASIRKLRKARQEGKLERDLSYEDELETAFKLGVISTAEVEMIKMTHDLQQDVIQVDEFAMEEKE